MELNPYINEDGSPREGFETECFAWARAKRLKEIALLPIEEQRKIREAEDALEKRMAMQGPVRILPR